MATVLRHGRKGGKVCTPFLLSTQSTTPAGAMSPASLQTPGEGTTIIGDPNAAHPFDPDAIVNAVRRTPASEANVLQFDAEVLQHIGKGRIVRRSKQVRTTTCQPQSSLEDVSSKLQGAISAQKKNTNSPKSVLGLHKLSNHDVLVVNVPHEALTIAAEITKTVPTARVLVVVPKYFEVNPVKVYLESLNNDEKGTEVGEICGQSFDGTESTRLWVTTAEMALMYLTKLNSFTLFTHVVVPDVYSTTQLLSSFVKALAKRLQVGSLESMPLRIILTPDKADRSDIEVMFDGLRIAFVESEVEQVTEFSYAEVCALVKKEMMVLERDGIGNFPAPTKTLIDYTAQISAELVKYIIQQQCPPQVIAVFTAEARDVLTAFQDAGLEGCAIYSGFKNTAEKASDKEHQVHVMNNVRHALDVGNEYTMVLDIGTIRQRTAQHRSESFMATSTVEWETKTELRKRVSILSGKKGSCYFALYSDDVAADFREDASFLPDIFGAEDVFLQCARLHIPMNEVSALLPLMPADITEQVMHNLAEKAMISNTESLAITLVGELTARLPVDLDIASFIISGCNIGLGEAALAIGSVAALPFRSSTPLTCSIASWNECTKRSREKYGGNIASNSDILADTLVFIEWLKLRARNESTADFLDSILVQESKMSKIEGLMRYMNEQLTNYLFLSRFDSPEHLEALSLSVRENSTILLLLKSVALAKRVAFIRDAGHINEKDRQASMAFVRTSKHLLPHNFIPSSIRWDRDRVLVPVILKSNTNIFAGLFSVIHTSYFFASLLLLYPHVEYSSPITTDKGDFAYFGVSCNCQMKRFMVSISDAVQILDFRQKLCLALGCMQAHRMLPSPVTRKKLSFALKEYDRSFDIERLQKEIRHELLELVEELKVTEHQGSFEVFATHCIAPVELLPMSDVPAMDVVLLNRFADGTLWESVSTPQSAVMAGAGVSTGGGRLFFGALSAAMNGDEDEEEDIEIIEDSYFVRNGPLIEEDEDD